MVKFTSVDAYIESFDGIAKAYLSQLRTIINKTVPSAEELITYNVPAIALIKGDRINEQIMIGAFKNHVGLYSHTTTMEHFWDQLKDYKKGKGSVQFPFNQPLPKKLISDMVKYRFELLIQ